MERTCETELPATQGRRPPDNRQAAALEGRNLSCRRSGRRVFKEISFALKPGTALIALGANGSGKSSLLRVLAGLLPLHGGNLLWQGQPLDAGSEFWRDRIRYVGHLDACKPEWTVGEAVSYWKGLCRGELLDDPFGMLRNAGADKRIRYLSAGQRRKLALTRLCLSGENPEPQVWLLDEPTTALDLKGQEVLVNLIERHLEASGIAVVASHQGIPLARAETLSLNG